MAKIEVYPDSYYAFECPGCGYLHAFDKRWTFNGDFDRPTFAPSLLCDKDDPTRRCHLFVRDGKIEFLDDCHHPLKGLTVDMVEMLDG